jgi:hypothetical protein
MMRTNWLLAWAAGSVLIVTFGVGAQAVDSGLPDADGSDHHAQRLLAVRCTVCHSIELIAQQRLDREHWGAIVRKMSTWGAQVSESEQQMLVAYLASRYHPDAGPDEVVPVDRQGTRQCDAWSVLVRAELSAVSRPAGRRWRGPQACRQSSSDRYAAPLENGLERPWRHAALGHHVDGARDRGYSQLASHIEVIQLWMRPMAALRVMISGTGVLTRGARGDVSMCAVGTETYRSADVSGQSEADVSGAVKDDTLLPTF